MNDKLTAWFPLLLLAVLAALTFWLDRAVQGDDGSEPWSVARLQKEVKKSKSGTSDKEDPLFWVKLEFVSQPVMEACERQLANLGYSEYKRGGPGL